MLKLSAQNKNCPQCGDKLDIDTVVPGQGGIDQSLKPEPGDVTFCFGCRTPIVFNEALNLVVPGEDEMYFIRQDPGFYRMVEQIDAARAAKPNMN